MTASVLSNGSADEGIYMRQDGKVGVTNNQPIYDLDVAGYIGMKGRVWYLPIR